MFHLQVFNPLKKEAWQMFCSCAIPPLLPSVLVRANAYLRALVMLRLSGTVLTNKHNSRTARAIDLISSLINVALS